MCCRMLKKDLDIRDSYDGTQDGSFTTYFDEFVITFYCFFYDLIQKDKNHTVIGRC